MRILFPFPARAAPVLVTARSLTLCFVFREGAIDRLVNIYKNVVHKTGVRVFPFSFQNLLVFATKGACFSTLLFSNLQGYLTESGFVNLQRVQMIMLAVGEVEDSIFKKRKDDDVIAFVVLGGLVLITCCWPETLL